MTEKAKVKETARLYAKLWRLPTFGGIIGRIAVEVFAITVVLSVLQVLRDTRDTFLTFLQYQLFLGAPIFLGSAALYLIVRNKNSPLDARRTMGAIMFATIFWLILTLIGALIDIIGNVTFFESRLTLLGMGLFYFALSFLIMGLSDYHPVRNFAGAIMPLLVFVLVAGTLSQIGTVTPQLPSNWAIIVGPVVIIDTFSVYYIFRAVSKPFERDLGINGPELLRAFGHAYLIDNPTPFEKIMTEIAEIQDLPVDVIVFKGDTGLVAVGVTLYVHPGPFRNIGSSALPAVVIEHVKEKFGVPAFVLHGTCTHHQNLTTKEDIPKVLAEIDGLIESTEVYNSVAGPIWVENGKFKVWSLFVGPHAIAITTSAPEFTDDIGLDVGRKTVELVRSRMPNVGGLAIVDAHNCIGEDVVSVMLGDPDAEEYIGAVASALFATINEPREQLLFGIYQTTPDNLTIREGIGLGGITALVLKTASKESIIVSVDGNNVEEGFREEIISILKSQGFDQAEIVTTDTHIVNAVSLSHKGYPPVGREKPEDVLDAIVAASVKAREHVQPVKVGLGFGKVKGLRTFGEKGFDTLTLDVAEASAIAKRIGLSLTGVTSLASLFLTLLL